MNKIIDYTQNENYNNKKIIDKDDKNNAKKYKKVKRTV